MNIIHSVNLGSSTHCGIPLASRPPITGNTSRATCPDCAAVREANGWKAPTPAYTVVTQGSDVGGNVQPMQVPLDVDPGVYVLAIADAVRIERERLGILDTLAPVIVRVWPVTEAGTRLHDGMREHIIRPTPANGDAA